MNPNARKSHSDPLGVVLHGELWMPEADDALHVDLILRVDDDDAERPDMLDLRFSTDDWADLMLNVPRVDLLRALTVLGSERTTDA